MTPYSKEVVAADKFGLSLEAAFDTHDDEIERLFDEEFVKPFLKEGEENPNVRMMLKLIRRRAAHKRTLMLAADRTLGEEQADDLGPRLERDSTTAELYKKAIDQRDLIRLLQSEDLATRLGFPDRIPNDATGLAEIVGRVLDRVERARFGTQRISGLNLTPQTITQELKPLYDVLVGQLKTVRKDRRLYDQAITKKQDCLEAFQKESGLVVRFLESFLNLLGAEKLAARLRPSSHQRPASETPSDNDGRDPNATPDATSDTAPSDTGSSDAAPSDTTSDPSSDVTT